jgi:hypothetical protein
MSFVFTQIESLVNINYLFENIRDKTLNIWSNAIVWCCCAKRSSKHINNFHRSENCICFDCQFVPIEFVQAVYCVMRIYPISLVVIFDQLVILFFSSPIG